MSQKRIQGRKKEKGTIQVLLAAKDLDKPKGTSEVLTGTELHSFERWNRRIQIWAIGPADLDPKKTLPTSFVYSPVVLFPDQDDPTKKLRLDENFIEGQSWLRGTLMCYHEAITEQVRAEIRGYYQSLPEPIRIPETWSPDVRTMLMHDIQLFYLIPQHGGTSLERQFLATSSTTPEIDFLVPIPAEDVKLVKKLVADDVLPIRFVALTQGGEYRRYKVKVVFNHEYVNKFLLELFGEADRRAVSRHQALELSRMLGTSVRVTVEEGDPGVDIGDIEQSQIDQFVRIALDAAFKLAWKDREDLPEEDYAHLLDFGFTQKDFDPEVFKEITTKWNTQTSYETNIKSHYKELSNILREHHTYEERETALDEYLKQHLDLAGSSSGGVSILKVFSGDAAGSMSGSADEERAKKELQKMKKDYYDKLISSLETESDFEKFVREQMIQNWEGQKEIGYFIPKNIKCKIVRKTDFKDEFVWEWEKVKAVAVSDLTKVDGTSRDKIDLAGETNFWRDLTRRIRKLETTMEQLSEKHSQDVKQLSEQHVTDVNHIREQLKVDSDSIVQLRNKASGMIISGQYKEVFGQTGKQTFEFPFLVYHAWIEVLQPHMVELCKLTGREQKTKKVEITWGLRPEHGSTWIRVWAAGF